MGRLEQSGTLVEASGFRLARIAMQFEGMQLELSSVTVVVVCGGPL